MTLSIGIDDKSRKKVGEILRRVLADAYVLYTKTRNYHWNVVGTQFHEPTAGPPSVRRVGLGDRSGSWVYQITFFFHFQSDLFQRVELP